MLYTEKHEIYNFDPGGINNLFSDRWNAINNLNEISNKFDLIYGSHSLEHVQNIKETMKKNRHFKGTIHNLKNPRKQRLF